jgi:hypothetical protein
VCWDPRREKWLASIGVGEETEYLGGFNEEIEAAKAYDRAALRYHDPANTNFPPSDYDIGGASGRAVALCRHFRPHGAAFSGAFSFASGPPT